MTTMQEMGIDRLSIVERIALAQDILESVAAEQPRPPLSEAKLRELDRRRTEHLANPDDVVLWEQVEAATLARLKR